VINKSSNQDFINKFCRRAKASSGVFSIRSFEGLACQSKPVAAMAEIICGSSNIDEYSSSKCHTKASAVLGGQDPKEALKSSISKKIGKARELMCSRISGLPAPLQSIARQTCGTTTPPTTGAATMQKPPTTGAAATREYLKPQRVEVIVQGALKDLPKRDSDTIMGLQNELKRVETLKTGLRTASEKGQDLQAVDKQVHKPVGQLEALPKLSNLEAQALTGLIKINEELKISPKKLTPESEAQVEEIAQEIEDEMKEFEKAGARISPTTGKIEYFDQEKRTWGPDLHIR
jgi:hypothetical protein